MGGGILLTMSSSRASLLVLGAAAFLVSADARVIDPLLNVVAGEFGTTVVRASIVVSAYTLPYGLFQLFYGTLGDRVGKLRVMAGALALFAIGTAGCAFVGDLNVFALLRFLTGVVAAAMIPLSLSYIGDKVPYEGRQVALGRFMSALMLGQILSATLGGVFGEYLGWRWIFLVFGAAALAVAGAMFLQSRRHPEERRERAFTLEPYLRLASLPAARVVLAAVFLEGCFVFGGLPFLATSMIKRFAFLRVDQVGLMLAGYGVGGLIYSLSVKKLVPRLGERGIVLLGGGLLWGAYLLMAWMPVWWLFLPAVVLFGMGFVTMHGTLQTRATELDPKARASAVSLFAFCLFLGQAVGPLGLAQVIGAAGFSAGFLTAGIGLLLLAMGVWVAFTRMPRAAAGS